MAVCAGAALGMLLLVGESYYLKKRVPHRKHDLFQNCYGYS